MFGFNKRKQRADNAAKVKLAKKILGKDSGRRVFGFACSPDISARTKMLAGELNIPIFALAEHMLELSNWLIGKIIESPEEREQLIQHLNESHIDARTLEKIAVYDRETAEMMEQEQRQRFKIDKAARRIVVNCINRGIKPEQIEWAINYGLRCRMAVLQGRPIPKDLPPDV